MDPRVKPAGGDKKTGASTQPDDDLTFAHAFDGFGEADFRKFQGRRQVLGNAGAGCVDRTHDLPLTRRLQRDFAGLQDIAISQ